MARPAPPQQPEAAARQPESEIDPEDVLAPSSPGQGTVDARARIASEVEIEDNKPREKTGMFAKRGKRDADKDARADEVLAPKPRERSGKDDVRKMLTEEQLKILEVHNAGRANVVPAANPPLVDLQWDDDLAAVAQAYAEQCVWEHNGARTVHYKEYADAYRYVGENLAATSAGSPSIGIWRGHVSVGRRSSPASANGAR